jgi:hypothetical protein
MKALSADRRQELELTLLAHALLDPSIVDRVLSSDAELSASAELLLDMVSEIPATVRGVGFATALVISLIPEVVQEPAATLALAERADRLTVSAAAAAGPVAMIVHELGGRLRNPEPAPAPPALTRRVGSPVPSWSRARMVGSIERARAEARAG